jgi:hypothetical protein
MTSTTRIGLALLPAALGLGVLGDWLLRATPWGLNVFLWLLAGLALLGALARRQQIAVLGEGIWLGIPALMLALGLAWRDSATLRTLDVCGLLICLAVGAARTREGQVRLMGVFDYVADFFRTAFRTAFGVFPLILQDVEWSAVPRMGWLPRVIAVGRGLLLVLPLLLLFGGLLMAADAVYSHLLSAALHIDTTALFSHLLLTGFLAWLTAGFGRALLLNTPPERAGETRKAVSPALGVVETGTILGLLNLLFLSFVLVQLRYFFGGAATLQATAGLTYAQYARSGFFELVWVAALVLPLLLGLHWLQRPGDARALRLFSWQAAVQVALLFVIMASAVARMNLYQSEYGLTELRLYTTAFMGWLAVVFVWFIATVLRGQRERFAFGAAVAGFGLIVALHIVNPDATIIRANLLQAKKGHTFDADYAVSLSADAVPQLTDALPTLPITAQGTIAVSLLPHWSHDQKDWRSWSWSRFQAFEAVQSHQAALLATQKFAPPVSVESSPDD